MSRSTRSTSRTARRTVRRTVRRSGTDARTVAAKANARRNLKYFTFQYSRDDVSHTRNANSVTIIDRLNNGTSVSLSLQEAKSLYDFLATQIRTR